MRYYVQNISTEKHTGFPSLKKACEFAWTRKASYETHLIHIGWFNLVYAENYKTFENFYDACKSTLKIAKGLS